MRRIILICAIGILLWNCSEPNKTFLPSEIALLPAPLKFNLSVSSFAFTDEATISVEDSEQHSAANSLIALLKNKAAYNLSIVNAEGAAAVVFKKQDSLQAEAYNLNISTKQIVIEANDAAGYFYGVQTIHQLLQSEETSATSSKKWLVPCVSIEDAPRFQWRAYMLDESRYFHGEKFVKQILDEMAILKMNIFHWHLTDDAGWRMEIKKYPKLTEVGSKRSDSEIETWKSGKLSGKAHGGFYTQEQIKDIVAYAAERQITIVPEFEMPGHASAAIAAYTWLGTAGKDIDVPVTFGRHYDNYDITKPEVLQFVKDVLTEMFQLFPSRVIHIGGDEVGYEVWNSSKEVQKYMKKNGISSPADLQVLFTNQISQFIEQNDRRMMGWNEIMGVNVHEDFEEKKNDIAAETSLASNVIVHFWKGNLDLATQAAKEGYGIVNSLHSNTYLDYDYEAISLEKAYSFDPIPAGLEEKYHKNIYGLGCQMWSEWTPTNDDVAYQTFPRIAAFAEVGWTIRENKNYESFREALKKMQKRWDLLGLNYAKE